MALDGVFLSLIKNEIESLIGGRVDKVHQPSREELLISLRTAGGVKKILFNTVSGSARVHITGTEIENPKQPPMFCMLMRKHLSSGRLAAVRQEGYERILMLDFDCTNELGDPVRLTLAAEIMGRRSNLLLLNGSGKIIDCLKRVGPEVTDKPVLPGAMYEMPPKDGRISLTDCEREQFEKMIKAWPGEELSKAIMKTLEGISPVFARECAFFTGHGAEQTVGNMTEDRFDRLWFFITKVRKSLAEGTGAFTVLRTPEGSLKDFCFCRIEQYGALMVTKEFSSPSELLDYFYSSRDTLARTKQKAADLFRTLSSTIERTERRVQNQKLELKDCEKREQLRQYGDLIMSNLYSLEKGMEVCEAENYYEEGCPRVRIKLDKRLDPAQNAQKYYREYRKLDTAEKKLRELIAAGEEESRYLDTVFEALTRAQTEGDIAELREELAGQGYVKRGRNKGKPPKSLPPMRFVSSEGYEIRVGRNNSQNDRLTCREAKKTDLWLHVKDITGCHVIIDCKRDTGGYTAEDLPPDRTIEEAAVIAAYYSRARNSSRADVDYTFIKNVKKPAGAKPGMVIFNSNYTITVKPDEDLVESLRAK
ncbi:MAG: NFACT family protein [Ruminococcus sp.]|nr:NFACT family protein [Ruminococcus sp.]